MSEQHLRDFLTIPMILQKHDPPKSADALKVFNSMIMIRRNRRMPWCSTIDIKHGQTASTL